MNRRKFLLSAGALAASPIVAKLSPLAAEPMLRVPDIVTIAASWALSAPWHMTFVHYMDWLLGPGAWHMTVNWKTHVTTIHLPEWLSDDWLRILMSWGENYRCAGDYWLWRRGQEAPVHFVESTSPLGIKERASA